VALRGIGSSDIYVYNGANTTLKHINPKDCNFSGFAEMLKNIPLDILNKSQSYGRFA
jgi:hypothetical protein